MYDALEIGQKPPFYGVNSPSLFLKITQFKITKLKLSVSCLGFQPYLQDIVLRKVLLRHSYLAMLFVKPGDLSYFSPTRGSNKFFERPQSYFSLL